MTLKLRGYAEMLVAQNTVEKGPSIQTEGLLKLYCVPKRISAALVAGVICFCVEQNLLVRLWLHANSTKLLYSTAPQQQTSSSYDHTQASDANPTMPNQISPGLLNNHLTDHSQATGSSTFQPMPTFSDSPNSNPTFSSTLSQPNHNSGHYPNINTASELASTSSGLNNPGFFPSSVPPVAFSADTFLTGLYENLQPQPQQSTDFSFLETWPFWLAATAANSPESANQNSNSLNAVSISGRTDSIDVNHHQQDAEGHRYSSDSRNTEPDLLADSHLIPAIASFFERLHPIMPIFTRSWILDRIDKDEHRSQPSLAAMLLALSSLARIQPVKAADRISRAHRNEQAKSLLEQSVKARANAFLGRTHSLDEVLASFYSFATLFGMQEHDAATFRLKEAITLAQLMKLNVRESYMFLEKGEQERRLRTYWLLCITERYVPDWVPQPRWTVLTYSFLLQCLCATAWRLHWPSRTAGDRHGFRRCRSSRQQTSRLSTQAIRFVQQRR